MPPGLSPGSRRYPATVAFLLVLSPPVPHSLEASLVPLMLDRQAIASRALVNTGAGDADLESAMPHNAEIVAPEPLAPSALLWLAIPSMSLWLWWTLNREAASKSAPSQAVPSPDATNIGLMPSRVQDWPDEDSNTNNDRPIPDRKDWIRLTPQSPEELQIDWKISAARKLALRQEGGRKLVLRLHKASGLHSNQQADASAHQAVQQYECSEQAQSLTLRLLDSDRSYVGELGYITVDGRWLRLVSSAQVVPQLNSEPTHAERDHQSSQLKASQQAVPEKVPKKVHQVRSQTRSQTRHQVRHQIPNELTRFWLEPLMLIVIAFLWTLTAALKLLTASLSFSRASFSSLLTPQTIKHQIPDS